MNNLIIGIAGGSGSGKTTLACRLKALFGEDEVRLISHDELPFEERCKLNYDHPDAFDNALLIYSPQVFLQTSLSFCFSIYTRIISLCFYYVNMRFYFYFNIYTRLILC